MREEAIFVSPGGDDAAAGTSEAPLRSVEGALQTAVPGTTIVLRAGEYPPVCINGISGTQDQPIVIRGENPIPIDFTPVAELDRSMYVVPLRRALDDGRLTVNDTSRLSVVAGRGHEAGLLIRDCAHLSIEDLVIRDARANLVIHRSQHVQARGCAVCGDPAVSRTGVHLRRADMEEAPSRFIRFERVLAYGLKEVGFGVGPGAAFDVEWDCCIAHGMQSSGGDGFSFAHVTPADGPRQSPCRVFADGVDYRMRLTRCAALRNRLDGFDLGNGVGGVTLEYCLGDGNGWGAYYAKDVKVWTAGNTFRFCRMTGRVFFRQGTHHLEDFKTGVKEDGPPDSRKRG